MANSNDSKALKSGIWYIACNFIAKGAVFLSTPLFTRLMSTEDVGLFSNITAWVNILSIITSLELATSVTFAKFEKDINFDEYISSVLVLGATVSLAFYIIAIIFHEFFEGFLGVDFLTLNLIFIYCIVSPALQMIQVKNRVLFQYKSSSILTISSVLISIISSLALVLLMSNRLTGRTIGYFGSLIVFNIGIFVYILIKGKRINIQYWKFGLSISIPMIIHLLSGQLLSSCDRIMITKICGSSQNALYSIAYTAATVITVLWTSLNTAWSPWAYDQMDNMNYKKLKYASRPYVLFFFFFVLAFILFAPEIMLIMGGKPYLEAIYVIPPVVIGMFFQYVYSLYVNIEFFHKKQKYTAVGTTIAALLNLILNWLLIPKFGYVAAAYTTLIGYIALFLIHFCIVKKMQKTWWYDTKFNLVILALSLLLVPVTRISYRNDVLRLIFIFLIAGVFVIVSIKYRKAISEAVQKRSFRPLVDIFNMR